MTGFLTDDSETRRAGGPAASVLGHAGPISFVLNGDRGHVDAVKIPLVDERESRARVHRLGISVPSDRSGMQQRRARVEKFMRRRAR